MPDSGDLIWRVRAYIYQHFASTSRPPTVHETAAEFGLTSDQAASIYRELHQRHTLMLEPGTTSVRMANPFSAILTPFRVHAEGHSYWANCAWDSLGIPAALHSDATIEARISEDGQLTTITLSGGKLSAQGELIHFPLPFRRWYDDLILT